jgi:hypothetical protein
MTPDGAALKTVTTLIAIMPAYLASLAAAFWAALLAPEGYETAAGFHYGRVP